jgi:hypothetical protein
MDAKESKSLSMDERMDAKKSFLHRWMDAKESKSLCMDRWMDANKSKSLIHGQKDAKETI